QNKKRKLRRIIRQRKKLKYKKNHKRNKKLRQSKKSKLRKWNNLLRSHNKITQQLLKIITNKIKRNKLSKNVKLKQSVKLNKNKSARQIGRASCREREWRTVGT